MPLCRKKSLQSQSDVSKGRSENHLARWARLSSFDRGNLQDTNCLRLPAWPGQVLARKGTGSLGGMKMEGIGLYLVTASSKYVSDTNDTTGWTG